MTAIACHLIRPRFNPLAMPTCRADRVGKWEDPAESLDDPRLAADDRPPLRRMIANLEEATVDRYVVPVDVEHHDVAGGDANDGIPCATPQRVRAGRADARPTLHLQTRGGDHPVDRKSTRLNSSHLVISYAVFCLKKKKKEQLPTCRRPDRHYLMSLVRTHDDRVRQR